MFWLGAVAGIAATLLVSVFVLVVIFAVGEWEQRRIERQRRAEERRAAVEEIERWVKRR